MFKAVKFAFTERLECLTVNTISIQVSTRPIEGRCEDPYLQVAPLAEFSLRAAETFSTRMLLTSVSIVSKIDV